MPAHNIRSMPAGGTQSTRRMAKSNGSICPAAAETISPASAIVSSRASPRNFSVTCRFCGATQRIFAPVRLNCSRTAASRSRTVASMSKARKVRRAKTFTEKYLPCHRNRDKESLSQHPFTASTRLFEKHVIRQTVKKFGFICRKAFAHSIYGNLRFINTNPLSS